MWLCNSMDAVRRLRALVKKRIEEDQTELDKKERERERIQKTTGEKEQELECELKRLKAMDKLFECDKTVWM